MASVQDIYNEIDRIENAKSGIAEAIEEKGVEVPAGTMIQDFPGKVRQIQTGSPDAVLYTPQDLTPEQQAQARQNIGAGTYTKPNTGIPETDFAQGVQTSLEKANTAVQPDALTPITDLIPEQATPQNQLADKNFVNSSVATNTANYISDNGQPFQSVADLEAYTGTLTNNDYAFVVGTDSAGNTTYTRYKYNATTQTWAAEYVLNNSSFTAEQWAAISSGITALLVQKLSELPTEIVTYVAQTLTEAQKQQARTNIGATAPEIFMATYGTTTAAEIETAINNGKVCFCVYEISNAPYVFQLFNINSTHIVFGAIDNSRNVRFVRVKRSDNVWSTENIPYQNSGNRVTDIVTNRTNTDRYPNTKGVFDLVGKWGVISQTQTWTGTDATGYDYTMSNLVYGLIPQANIDLYVAAGAVFNETTGYFELNGLTDISYNEMKAIYNYGNIPYHSDYFLYGNFIGIRTNLPTGKRSINSLEQFVHSNESIEVCAFNPLESVKPTSSNAQYAFRYATHMKKVVGVIEMTNITSVSRILENSYTLQQIFLRNVRVSLSFAGSPQVDLLTFVYLVNYAANTTAITITLHATAYARCQADTTEYTYNGQTYTGIIAYAAAKNITIASA